ncbi:MAG: GtrA family protein [Fimbriimonadaceae bacterium]
MILREAVRFGIVGLAQIGLDWAVFVGLTALSAPVLAANVCGRVSGASFGFFANAHFTFSHRRREPLGREALLRFVGLWVATMLASTAAMMAIESGWGLGSAWLLKPVVDALLAAGSFLASRHWVYR